MAEGLSSTLSGVLSLYIGTFAARLDEYVRDSSQHVHEPLTPDVAFAALGVGGFSVSGYLAVPDDDGRMTTHVGAIDFDTEDGLVKARSVRSWLSSHGVEGLLEESRRGAHLWVFTTVMMYASTVRNALRAAAILADCDMRHTEVFPKLSASDWGVGALRMPLMRHPKSGVRYPVYAPSGASLKRVQDVISTAVDCEVPPEAIRALAGPLNGVEQPWPQNAYPRASGAVLGPVPGVTEVLAGYGITVRPGKANLCPFHDDRQASLSVARDDERAWCKAPTCPLNNDGRGLGSFTLAKALAEGVIRWSPPP